MIKKYDIEWVSSIDASNKEKLEALSNRMRNFYATNSSYYADIADSESLWIDENYFPLQEILNNTQKASNILEIGCGQSPILKFYPDLKSKYTGIDFSNYIISDNKKRFPEAEFYQILDPYNYSLVSGSFDLVFSIFVIEHTVFPQKFLEECIRLLKPNGRLIILAPSYLDYGTLASQQTSPDLSSGRELIKKGKFFSALRAGFYSKVLIPIKSRSLKKHLPGFYINLNPICFIINQFRPDVDAVYIVSEKEIELYMKSRGFQKKKNSQKIKNFITNRRLCFQIYKKG